MNRYPDRYDKIALCLQSATMAKSLAVREFGLGEELPFTLFGWRADELAVVGTLAQPLMNEDPQERLRRLAFAAAMFRQSWGVDEFVFLAEGFVSMDPEKTAGRPLREAFIDPESEVSECLTFTFISATECEVVTQAFSLQYGRTVEWGKITRSGSLDSLRESVYALTLQNILGLESNMPSSDGEILYLALAKGLEAEGFSVQWNFV